MKEIIVAELDKEEIKVLKKLLEEDRKLASYLGESESKKAAFWDSLRRKHKLDLSSHHYIKDNKICLQVM